MSDYQILRARDVLELSDQANAALDEGWVLCGTPFAIKEPGEGVFFFQGLTRQTLRCDSCSEPHLIAELESLSECRACRLGKRVAVMRTLLVLIGDAGEFRNTPQRVIDDLAHELMTVFGLDPSSISTEGLKSVENLKPTASR